jgi:hypothetical protein
MTVALAAGMRASRTCRRARHHAKTTDVITSSDAVMLIKLAIVVAIIYLIVVCIRAVLK